MMKFTPHILGAVAVVAIAGAVSGATIGESPVLKRGHTDTLPQAAIVSASNPDLQTIRRPPDHYPLKTPEGTIEVAELALHGRLRNRGGDMWWDRSNETRRDLGADYDFYAEATPEEIERERRLLAFHGEEPRRDSAAAVSASSPQQAMTRAEAPMALAEPVELADAGPPPSPTIGNAKTVDVRATLAARD